MEEWICNWEASRRAGQTIETLFGVQGQSRLDTKKVESVIKAAVILVKYFRFTDESLYTPHGSADCEKNPGEIIPCNWKKKLPNGWIGLLHLLKNTVKAYFW